MLCGLAKTRASDSRTDPSSSTRSAGRRITSVGQVTGSEVEMRQTSDASGFRFCQEIPDALEQERQVQRFFHERIDADANGVLILMGPGGDDDDGHQWSQPANPFKRRPTVC